MTLHALPDADPARQTLEEGWIAYVQTGQFADIVARLPAEAALTVIREARVAWYAGVSHGVAAVVVDEQLDPALVAAVADQLYAWVKEEDRARARRA